MLNRFSLGVAVFMFAAFVVQASGQSGPKPMGVLAVSNSVEAYDTHNNRVDVRVFVMLYKDGQVIRTNELSSPSDLTWYEVPAGAFEVHFQAKGYGKVIKRYILVQNETIYVNLASMDKKDEVWGDGPSLFELQKRIETLETANTALKTEVTALKTEVAALKKAK